MWQQGALCQLGGLNLDSKCRISLCQLWYMMCRKTCVNPTKPFFLLVLFLEFHCNLNNHTVSACEGEFFHIILRRHKTINKITDNNNKNRFTDNVLSVYWLVLEKCAWNWLGGYRGIESLCVCCISPCLTVNKGNKYGYIVFQWENQRKDIGLPEL